VFTEKYNNAIPRGLAASVVTSLILFALLMVPVRLQAKTGEKFSGPRGSAVASATAAAQQSQVKYKGIWEPVNYKEDLQFLDVFFATVDEGWVSGKAGTILHTVDGGKSWTAELGGDPQSADAPIEMFRFLDQRHGWAVQNHKLLKTTDGQDWEEAGTIVQNMADYRFLSPQIGVALGGGGMSSEKIFRTVDGGRNWKQVFECATKLEIEGLTKQVGCWFLQLHFTSPRVGYAVGGHPMCGNCGGPPLIAKTEDGGMSWRILVGPGDPATATLDGVFFIDDQNGFVRVSQGQKLFVTNDGGQTWRGVVASPAKEIRFADPEVGWSFEAPTLSYTVDGGKHWMSRDFRFPASAYGFSLPRRDRGYIVGDHGMIYRYRIVPIEYTATGMIPAPLFSGIDSPLDAQVQQLAQQVQQLAKDVGAPPMDFSQDTGAASPSGPGSVATFSPDTSGAAGTPTSFNTGVTGGTFSGAVPGCPAIGLPASSAAFGNSAPPMSSATAANSPAPSPGSSGGFAQDTGVSAGFVQDTGTATAMATTVSATVPQFVSKYRNLNLMLTGLQVATQMPATVQCMKQSFEALKNVKNPQAAMSAVMNIQGQMTGLMQMARLAFQKR
jgi:photosystem II stability/assembly factor-like uncharacterized protein